MTEKRGKKCIEHPNSYFMRSCAYLGLDFECTAPSYQYEQCKYENSKKVGWKNE